MRSDRPFVLPIVADDLSGAADCAASFARPGRPVEVWLGWPKRGLLRESTSAQGGAARCAGPAIDLDSRALPAARAVTATREAFAALRAGGFGAVYKKIDSTLRGHVGEELAAALDILGSGWVALVCPAFPAQGRVLRSGRLEVGGKPLEATEFRRHEAPGKAAGPVAQLEASGIRCALLDLGQVRTGAAGLATAARAALAGGARAIVFDAETVEDLGAIASFGLGYPGSVLFVGSAGLAREIALRLDPSTVPARAPHSLGPTLLVVGSLSERATRQCARLREAGIEAIGIPAGALLDGSDPSSLGEIGATIERVRASGGDVLVWVEGTGLGSHPGASGGEPPFTRRLGRLVTAQLPGFGSLILTGGATARAVLEAAGIQRIEVTGELEPGLPLATCATGHALGLKAGGFGDEGTLLRMLRALRGERGGAHP